MRLVVAIMALAFLAGVGGTRLQSTAVEVVSERLPASLDGFCIVQLSDLHGRQFGRGQGLLVKKVSEASPDLIALTGDLTRWGRWDSRDVRELAYRLRSIGPVCYVTGNHDCYGHGLATLEDLLLAEGAMVLAGTSAAVSRAGGSIVIAGIEDPSAYGFRGDQREAIARWRTALAALRAAIPRQEFTVLLSHRPEFFDEYERLGFDVVLSGHAHGGQVRLPFVGALYAPDQGWFPRLTSGAHRRGRTTLVVSRGLGNSKFPIRIFNRPELVVVRLKRPRT